MTALLDRGAPTAGFAHEAMFYRGEAEFLDGVLPFVREGLEQDETVLVAEPGQRLQLLREALGEDAGHVQFLDMAEIGANPARILGVWASAVARHADGGLRGVGEPAWFGRRPAELVECQLHEVLLNHAFTGGPSWRLMCPYDEQHLPGPVCRGALQAHPVRATPGARRASTTFADDAHVAAFAAPLPPSGDAVLRGTYGPADVPAARRTVAQYARSCGLPEEQAEVLELAASELATNSIRHGGGQGTLAMWLEPGAAVVEFSDAGHLHDPLVGRRMPPETQEGGRGLYLVNQLCDLVQLRSSPTGTTVRITTWL
jgi:anti-sigma regulatory factor (Ser/Thr protein kinase)